ncbi:phosphoserine phosphatase SerB [Erythrobacteraceae bacterium CFH 75059]|uniref:phosphoserine phosphatase SerB n=1 Tax=Qipengyuania thermophila TaxID=2509361 RepID=UPI001020FE17|nr:phosphoserine phosphatase SerB [Qipengyuania thermophila]TCD05109.1 phosphoserine phosphatase SerB [Erythrobacteraceae bacterium CFH 75059]
MALLTARVLAEPDLLRARAAEVEAALCRGGFAHVAAEERPQAPDRRDWRLADGDTRAAARILADVLGPCDVLVTKDTPQAPALFVSDMDSTIIAQECIDELADYAGVRDAVARVTERAMRGELDFAASLRGRVALLRGVTEEEIAACLRDRIVPHAGARDLLRWLRSEGCRTVLVTGGFTHFAAVIADALGFDRVEANRLEMAEGRLTGRVLDPILDAQGKAAILDEERGRLAGQGPVLALGDGANDVAMLARADIGGAYHGKPVAQEQASLLVNRGDLASIVRLFA